MQGTPVLMRAAIGQQRTLHSAPAQVEAHLQLERRRRVLRRGAPTARPPRPQRVGQHHRRAIQQHHRAEPLQQGQDDRLGGDHRAHRLGEQLLEEDRRPLRAALLQTLRADRHPRDRCRLRPRLHRRLWVGQPGEHQCLHEGCPAQLRAPLHEVRRPRRGLGRRRQQGLHRLSQLCYRGHQEAPFARQGLRHPHSAKGALLRDF